MSKRPNFAWLWQARQRTQLKIEILSKAPKTERFMLFCRPKESNIRFWPRASAETFKKRLSNKGKSYTMKKFLNVNLDYFNDKKQITFYNIYVKIAIKYV